MSSYIAYLYPLYWCLIIIARLAQPLSVHCDNDNLYTNDLFYNYYCAVLECASQEELANPPPPDTNNPEPLHITFSFGYVPTGVFCGLITRLVSQGPHKILGFKWKLVEDGVKRNCVSFYVDSVHKVTLLSHEKSYEIRVSRQDPESSLHDLCAHALSVVLYFLKTLYENLVPLIAFQCPCSNHKAKQDVINLCTISDDSKVRFLCKNSMKLITLKPEQRIWLGTVSMFVTIVRI